MLSSEAGQLGLMPDFEGLVSARLKGLPFVLKLSSSYRSVKGRQGQDRCRVGREENVFMVIQVRHTGLAEMEKRDKI